MPAGRPLKFQSVEELQGKIDGYWVACEEEGRHPTISGLADHLDCDRDTILEYSKKAEYSGTIKRAKQKIERHVEESLFTMRNPAGAIFNLKNNFGWKDKQEIDARVANVTLKMDEDDAGVM